MKLISWNVAGYRACLKKGFKEFFEEINADIFSLQEVKATQEQIDYIPEGYYCYRNVAEKKGYSGVITYTKEKPINVTYGLGIDEHDHEGRLITLEYEYFYLINVYVPNAQRELTRLDYRMTWEDDFRKYVNKLKKKKMVIICGDMNVAHEEIDLKNPKTNVGNAGFTYEERNKMTELLESGFIDTFRYFHKDAVKYSWWSYMRNSREKNIGWRIDYFLVDKDNIDSIIDSKILDNIMGSDHCPIELDL